MTCQHDPTYRIENEANGGTGCPICNSRRKVAREQRAALGLMTDADRTTETPAITLMTIPQILAGRAAAELHSTDEMREVMAEARLDASRAEVKRHSDALARVNVKDLLAQHNAEVDERKARLRAWGGDRWVDHALPSDTHKPTGYGMEVDG